MDRRTLLTALAAPPWATGAAFAQRRPDTHPDSAGACLSEAARSLAAARPQTLVHVAPTGADAPTDRPGGRCARCRRRSSAPGQGWR